MEQFKFIDLKAKATNDSITIEWGIETDIPENGFSQWAYLFIGDDPVGDPVELPVKSRSCTFQDLKADTEYYVYLQAYLEPSHELLPEEFTVVKTEVEDTVAPTVIDPVITWRTTRGTETISNKTIYTDFKGDTITLRWAPATDNLTSSDKIRYVVYQEVSGAWTPVKEGVGIYSYEFTHIVGERFSFKVEAYDEKDNVLVYPTETIDLTACHLYLQCKTNRDRLLVPAIVRPYSDSNPKIQLLRADPRRAPRIRVFLRATSKASSRPDIRYVTPIDSSLVVSRVSDETVLITEKTVENGITYFICHLLKNGTSDVTIRIKNPKGGGYVFQQTFTVEVNNPEWK